MRFAMCTVVLLAFAASAMAESPELARELDDVARVASVMLDGDVCRRIPQPRKFKLDPRDQWQAADNYDVDHAAFIQSKKTLARLARLCSHECDLVLWMPIANNPGQVQLLIRNVHDLTQFRNSDALQAEMPAPMKQVLDSGQRVTLALRPGMVSVLAPVYDSLGDIAAVVEVVSNGRPAVRRP